MSKALVIVPTYNEADNIINIIESVLSLSLDFNILIVDDNSPDGTGFLVQSFALKNSKKVFLLSRDNKDGLGKAYTDGFNWALKNNYNYIFEMDADFSHDPKELAPMLEKLKINTDLVVGSRYVNGVNVVNWPMSRILLSYFASKYVQLITSMPIKDATAGFVGYRRAVLESISMDEVKFVGYAFQIELKYKAWIKKFKLEEHPIIFTNRILGKSKMSSNIIWEALYGVLFLRLNKNRFK